jgi:hypothetical protein
LIFFALFKPFAKIQKKNKKENYFLKKTLESKKIKKMFSFLSLKKWLK